MGRKPCCEKVGLKKGPWTADEDKKLVQFILNNGQCCWRAVPKLAGLLRCGKSCRLRWTNYLRPDVKRGLLSEQEEKMVIDLHAQLGNRWSKIASNLPGRTDNEIKNHWNTHIKKRLRKMGIDPLTHKPLHSSKSDDLPNPKADSSEATPKVDGEGVINDDDDDTSILQNSTFATMDLVNEVNTATNMNMNMNTDDFCVDEIPVIEPHEILLPASCDTSSTASTSSSSSSYSSTFDDLLFSREINDMYNEMMIGGDIWNDDFNALDLFISNDDGVGDDQGSWIRF